MTTEPDLRAAMATAFEHLRPGGVAVFEPDHVREQFAVGTDHGGDDGPPLPDGRPGPALRYLEWTTDPDPSDSTYQVEYAVLTRDAGGTVRVRHDQQVEGLFPQATWLSLMTDVGLQAITVDDPLGRAAFVGVRRAAAHRDG